jgi:glycosyltransferase involved in cell wall biosynthesis
VKFESLAVSDCLRRPKMTTGIEQETQISKPRVTAVIPTRNRADLVCRAVESVLSQTMTELECVVVVDGPDPATCEALARITDSRLKVLTLEQNVGGCEARNIGIRAARGEWIALLDDDDEWLPHRLETQLDAATSGEPVTMVASRFLDRAGYGDLVRPRKFPKPGQPISEFLWCEVSAFGGIEGFPQTSTWLVKREFALEVPFTKDLRALQDLDWLLHAFAHPQMRVRFVTEPLTVFHNDVARARVAKRIDWKFCYDWAMSNRSLFTKKAFGYFLVVYCVNPAAQQGASRSELRSLLADCRRYGKISPKLLWLYSLYSLVYPTVAKLLSSERRKSLLYKATNLARGRWLVPDETVRIAPKKSLLPD